MKKSLLLLISVAFSTSIFAQIPSVGGIAFVGFQNTAPDGFAFVTLEDIPASTQISFTDNGWDGSALWTTEQTLIWTSPSSTLAAGSVIYIYDDNSANGASLMIGPGTVTGELPNLSSSGEQILAYTGLNTDPSFIAAISNSGFEVNCVTGTPNTNITCLPSPLVVGVSAQTPVNAGEIIPNLFFNIDTISGTIDEIMAALMNPVNWTTSIDVTIAGHDNWPNWEFNFNEQVSSVVTISPTSLSMTEGVSLQQVTLNFNPATIGAQSLSIDLSGAISANDLNCNYLFSGNSILIDVPDATSSLIIQLNAINDGIEELTEVGDLSLSQLSNGLSLGSQDQCSITILDSLGTSPTLSLFINEVMSSNANTIANEAGIYADWIELYNSGDSTINLAGLYISDDINQLTKYQFPTGSNSTLIDAGGFKLVWADDSTEIGPLHAAFKIAAAGEKLYLSYGSVINMIDSISVPALSNDESWGRQIDGGIPWIVFGQGTTTPMVSNELTSIYSFSESDFDVYPNPANNEITIRQNALFVNNRISNIAIYSIEGLKLMSFSSCNYNPIFTLPIADLKSGVYQLYVQRQNKTTYKKFIKI